MKRFPLAAFAALLTFCSLSTAQATYPIGFIDFGVRNRTQAGSPILQSRIYYPAQWAGYNAPLRPQAGGYPTFLWLHGAGSLGRDYFYHGQMFAERGWVCVLQDTAPWDQNLQFEDAKAAWPSLNAENQDPASFFYGALDMSRSALAGYSVGGMIALRTLLARVGYKAGFGVAPTGGSWVAPNEFRYNTLPFGIVQGTGDTLVWWQDALAYYNWSSTYSGQKLFYLMNNNATHINVASVPSQADFPVFLRAMNVMLGFLGAHVRGDATGLEKAVGGDARSEPNVSGIYSEVQQPRLWVLQNGRSVSIRETSEPGPVALLGALNTGYQMTKYGELLLDPGSLILLSISTIDQSKLLTINLTLLDDPALRGKYMPIQAIGIGHDSKERLTDLGMLSF